MNSAFLLLAITLAAFACQSGEAVTLRVGRYTPATAGTLNTYEDKIIAAMTAGKYTVKTVLLKSYDDRLTCLTTNKCDAVIAQFTVTPDRQKLVTFLAPYYFGDGAGVKARTQALANLVKVSTNPTVAYAPYKNTAACIPAGSAYQTAAAALFTKLTIKPDEASVVADPACLLLITDFTATVSGMISVKGPLLTGTALPQGVAVQLKKAGQTAAQVAIRTSLTESAVALYQGTPGSTPIEVAIKVLGALAGGALATIKAGAVFIVKFFAS